MPGREEARDLMPSRAKRLIIGFIFLAYNASTIFTAAKSFSNRIQATHQNTQ